MLWQREKWGKSKICTEGERREGSTCEHGLSLAEFFSYTIDMLSSTILCRLGSRDIEVFIHARK